MSHIRNETRTVDDVEANMAPSNKPKETLIGQAVVVLLGMSLKNKVAMLVFCLLAVLSPIGTNWLMIQMIQGSSNGLAILFVCMKLSDSIVDILQDLFLINVGVHAEVDYITKETLRYSKLSKSTTYRYPAETTIAKDLTSAASSIQGVISWGMRAVSSTFGRVMSSVVLLLSADVMWYDGISFIVIALVFWKVLTPLQKILTERMETYREKHRRSNNLVEFRSSEFQNKECSANEFAEILTEPVAYNINVEPIYTYTFNAINIAICVVMLFYAWFLPNDNAFAAKYILLSSISGAASSIAGFGTQYKRFCNEYEKYYEMFRDEKLEYDQHIEPKELPKKIVLSGVSLKRGDYHISCEAQEIEINAGDNFIIQGQSGAGKSTFLDAFMGYIPGISLSDGVNIRSYSHGVVCQLQNVQSISVNNVSICDVFRSNDIDEIRDVLCRFFDVDELNRLLENISSTDAFNTYVEGKMSGGQKTRFFLAATLFKSKQKAAKIVFLDEPEQGQDPELQIKSFKAINAFCKENNLTVFWITHLRPELLKETGIVFSKKLQFNKVNKSCRIDFSTLT